MEDSKDTPLDRFADNLLARIDEPKIGEMTISEVMTRQSLESARIKYKDRARGIFDNGFVGGPHIVSLKLQLLRAAAQIQNNEVSPTPFEGDEAEQVAATLALTGVVYAGQYTWCGKGGNMPGDPRFDAEEVSESTVETRQREELIAAMIKYAEAGAGKARQLKADNVRELFVGVFSALETNFGRDPDDGFTQDEANRIVGDFVEASRLLYGEVRAYLIEKGDLLSSEREALLFEKLNDSMKTMEILAQAALVRIREEGTRNRKIERVLDALTAIGVQLQESFLPLAMEYGKSEEANAYDETRITTLLTQLTAEVYARDSAEFCNCRDLIEDMQEYLQHPFDRHAPRVYLGKNGDGETTVYLPDAFDNLVARIREGLPVPPPADKDDEIKGMIRQQNAKLDRIIANTQPPVSGRPDVVMLVIDVCNERFGGRSVPKAVEYVRRVCQADDKAFHSRCVEARQIARDESKKVAKGEDKFWRTVQKYAQPSSRKSRAKSASRRSVNMPPGPCPIPDRSWGVSSAN